MIPYAPDDVLALRSYVATGGSLLVIVSPGWEPAQPGNQNSLLWLFGVQADQEMEVRAKSTKIVPHAITENVTSVMAKNAVNLKVPPGTGLIQAGDRTVLAAFPYRQGRVVVASFGQWFMPSPFFAPNGERVRHWSYQLPRESLPLEYGPQRELPLLANVIRWLTEPRPDDEQLQDRRKPFAEALAASLNVQFNLAPRNSLKDAMKKLIAEAPGGVWKEEALWTAGEASMRGPISACGIGWGFGPTPTRCLKGRGSRISSITSGSWPSSRRVRCGRWPSGGWRTACAARRRRTNSRSSDR